MAQIVYSRNALANLKRLHRFLTRKNPDAAVRAIRTIRDKIVILSRFPKFGRVDPEQPDYRELFILFGDAGYVARYRLDGKVVVILAVRHAREAGYNVDA
ncbi:MAG TPA: type II toxin-antitoxin system RelE/ParE family toxin [Reyranella sp.]|nr:type II toxin-antitoxin system RelE/ParE family toxin [Reyranella sp.]